MGIPKFFRYISERYPCINELAREHSIPEFDNLYLDMNGIIHNCSHPEDTNIHFHLEEEQVFQDIFNYVDKLFYLIKPQKLFFLAVDGVAPRAKMNQQRGRRFRTAREAEEFDAKAAERGEKREHKRFDSNCITPGTVFMAKLQKALRCFLRTKLSTDALWQKCRIILSGHETPGEGEHKIMDYIRYQKAQTDFDPNTRHCLYGLDADLIILGMCTHELHFIVLREEVKFGRNNKRTSVDETRFFLLHLGLLREYLELEFSELCRPGQKLDFSQLIDDWLLMGFLVGNDFIPHLPCLHISSNALPLIYKTYISVYPKLGGNINEQGKLNLQRLELFMKALSEVELELFEEVCDDLKYMHAKTEAFDFDVNDIDKHNYDADLAALIDQTQKLYDDNSSVDSDDEPGGSILHELNNYKRNYYRNKFENEMQPEFVAQVTRHYVTTLQWILDYYYRGIQSWEWFYPFHYAPFISDFKSIHNEKIQFDIGKPFLPFEQLLAVLPSASSNLLPAPYQDLMHNPNSPLSAFYPKNFSTDLNGKKHDWEAVVLIPFIDQDVLFAAMKPCNRLLSSEEHSRNKHGPMHQYVYTPESQGEMPACPPLKALYNIYCIEQEIWPSEVAVNLPHSVCVDLPNELRHVYFPGFPTMRHLPFTFQYRFNQVRFNGQPTRRQNIVLLPKKRSVPDTVRAVAAAYMNKVVYIGWPHLTKAKVVKVGTETESIDENGAHPFNSRMFQIDRRQLSQHLESRMGIEFDNYDVLVYVRTFKGSNIEIGKKGIVTCSDSWSSALTAYPSQGVLIDLAVHDSMQNKFGKVEELFPIGSQVISIGTPYYGCEGTVLDPMMVYNCGRIKVMLKVRPDPDLQLAHTAQFYSDEDYMNDYDVAKALHISYNCLSRITGSVPLVLGPRRERTENMAKQNVGLKLKFPHQMLERFGYCRRLNNNWQYSSEAVALIRSYIEKYPNVVDFLSSNNRHTEYLFEEDLYPQEVGKGRIESILNFLRQSSSSKAELVASGTRLVCKDAVEAVLNALDSLKSHPIKEVKLQLKPHFLIKPNYTLPDVYKSNHPIRLLDRVIIVRTVYMVPVGIKGTIVGICPVVDPNPMRIENVRSVETFYEVLFDQIVPNSNDIHGIAEERVYKVPESAVVCIFGGKNGYEPPPCVPQQYKEKKSTKNDMTNRYVTAASTDWNKITMKSKIDKDFLIPESIVQPEVMSKPLEPKQPMENWRTLHRPSQPQERPKKHTKETPRNRQPQQWRQPQQLHHPQIDANWRVQMPPMAGQAAPVSSQRQTQALKSLLGLTNGSEQPLVATTATEAATSSSSRFPFTNPLNIIPKLPQPPLFWQQEAQLQHQKQLLNYDNSRLQIQQQQQLYQQQQQYVFPSTSTDSSRVYVPTQFYYPTNEQLNQMSTFPPMAQPFETAPLLDTNCAKTVDLIKMLKIEPQTTSAARFFATSQVASNATVPNAAAADAAGTIVPPATVLCATAGITVPAITPEEEASTYNVKQEKRRPRKPRIGAKFDLDYIH